MNTQSIIARKVAFGGMEQPGDFTFDEDFSHIYIWLPGCSGPDSLQIQRGEPGGSKVWGWDGNTVVPSLCPSIHTVGYWHGYFTAGMLKSC